MKVYLLARSSEYACGDMYVRQCFFKGQEVISNCISTLKTSTLSRKGRVKGEKERKI